MDDKILEPLKYYNEELKQKHLDNAIKYFDHLVKTSGIDVNKNKELMTKLDKDNGIWEKVKKSITAKIYLMVLLIIGILLAVAVLVVMIYFLVNNTINRAISIPLIVVAVILGIIFFFIIKNSILKKINLLKNQQLNIQKNINATINEANGQMQPLNSLYDWNIVSEIVNETVPLIKLDRYFNMDRYLDMVEKYGLLDNTNNDSSIVFVQSGSILGNPFLICKELNQLWINKVYSNSITIHWTERVTRNGRTQIITRSQVLTASITKPAPSYQYQTYLIYANDAAPDLEFSRKPMVSKDMDDGDIEKFVKKRVNDLDDLAKEALEKGGNYTRLGNDEFEALFGGEDRNHEVQYRLLFTPLAQKNEINLLLDKVNYGDDFQFLKRKKLNYIYSYHSQEFDYNLNPINFYNYNLEKAKNFFIDYNVRYFKSLYFDLLPLISIPLYQVHKSIDYIYGRNFKSNIPSFEHECIANGLDHNLLKPDDSITNIILKTNFIEKNGTSDKIKVTAYAFAGINHQEIVTMMGNDGRSHAIPVNWIEYVPVSKDSYMEIKDLNISKNHYDDVIKTSSYNDIIRPTSQYSTFQRGLVGYLLINEAVRSNVDGLDALFNIKTNKINENTK